MAKQKISPIQNIVFVPGPLWEESFVKALKSAPNLAQKVKEFRAFKTQNPLVPFGSNDRAFISDGIYKQYLPKARKAHLTQDISIVYELSGRDPTVITLLGVFSHADLGTGQPANKNTQQNMAKRLAREDISG